jgi:hypothetical protein
VTVTVPLDVLPPNILAVEDDDGDAEEAVELSLLLDAAVLRHAMPDRILDRVRERL